MPVRPPVNEGAARFLRDLADSLDVEQTIKKLGLTRDEARSMLKALLPAAPKTASGQKDLFGEDPPVKRPGHKALHTIHVDGASRGNPGQAGAGAVIKDHGGHVVKRLKKYLGITTNNVAEYQALIMALEAAHSLGLAEVRIFADSELMVKQINGVYRVKSAELKPLHEKAERLFKSFGSARLSHVPRAENSLADAMANEAIDGRAGEV